MNENSMSNKCSQQSGEYDMTVVLMELGLWKSIETTRKHKRSVAFEIIA